MTSEGNPPHMAAGGKTNKKRREREKREGRREGERGGVRKVFLKKEEDKVRGRRKR